MMQSFSTLAWEFSDPISKWLRSVFLKPSNSELGTDAWGTDNLFLFVTWINIFGLLIVIIPMMYWVVKYRRRPGVPAQRTANHNTALEVTWVVVPLIILTGVFFWGFQGYMKAQVAKSTAEVINVTGRKWNWEVRYGNGATTPVQVYLDDHTTPNADGRARGKLHVLQPITLRLGINKLNRNPLSHRDRPAGRNHRPFYRPNPESPK